MTSRSDNDKFTSWYLAMVFAGVDPDEAREIIEVMRADEAKLNAVPAG
jgi:hypothetical protein